jgi:phosphoribosylanthranilate isomerase
LGIITFAPLNNPFCLPELVLIVARAVVAGIFASGHNRRVSESTLQTISSLFGTNSSILLVLGSSSARELTDVVHMVQFQSCPDPWF